MNFCLQTTLACEHASKDGFCTGKRCAKLLDEIRGPRGPKGPPGVCPRCGGTGGIAWDPETDTSWCGKCGWRG